MKSAARECKSQKKQQIDKHQHRIFHTNTWLSSPQQRMCGFAATNSIMHECKARRWADRWNVECESSPILNP